MTARSAEASDDFVALRVIEEVLDAGDRGLVAVLPCEQAISTARLVAIPEHVIERGLRWGRAAAPNEWYGLVVGRIGEDARGRHVVVLGIVPDAQARATPDYVETSADSEFATRELCRRLYPDGVILGWAHGHHRCGARYSSVDRRNQATWSQPHALGLVFDPWDPVELSAYRGPGSELLVPVPRRTSSPEATSPNAFTTRPTGPCRGVSSSGERAPRQRRRPIAKFVVTLVGIVCLALAGQHQREEHRLVEALARRVRALELRPLPARSPAESPVMTTGARPQPGSPLASSSSAREERPARTTQPTDARAGHRARTVHR